MGSVSRDSHTIIEKTRDGEITVNLVLTIKLDGNNLSVVSDVENVKPILNLHQKDDDKLELEIPDFDIDDGLINFGKE